MRGGERDTLALADVGDSTVLIRSSLPAASASRAIATQILPALSARHRSAPGHAAGSRAALRVAPAAAVEDITHADWLFTGSLYSRGSGIAKKTNRLDPVSVIWKGGGQASIANVRDYTESYWHASAIPHGYPGGDSMKPRDLQPLCRDAKGVFFRYTGTKPNAGKWEQSDPHGFMSTSGLCLNQYHIRMWSSTALHDLTGHHLLEFVLAPIHHDHSDPILHGRPDLSFDKARYAYARIMSYKLCTFIHWKINPESELFNYQGLGKYSGFVSRIAFWFKAQHASCNGV